jgi:hypothetical protein
MVQPQIQFMKNKFLDFERYVIPFVNFQKQYQSRLDQIHESLLQLNKIVGFRNPRLDLQCLCILCGSCGLLGEMIS